MQIGIDLGTTNTVVAYFKNERIEYLKFKRDETLSSVILYKDGKVTVGEKAKKKAVSNPKNFIKSSKAYMGDSSKSWEIEDRVFSPTEVATEILKEIRNSFKDVSEIEAVITVPAYFKSNQIDETKKAGEKAGFKVKQIITEPVAAAVAYGFEDEVNQKLFIVDIGGGTFDVSLLEVSNRTFNTLSVDGDRRLGGDDFDEHVLEFLLKYVRKEHGVNLASFEKSGIGEDDYFKAKQALISKAEDVKKELSEAENVEVEIPNLLSGYNLKTSISRDKFEEISEETISKIERIIQKSKSDVDKVVLVGGTSRIPAVREFVTKLFGKSPYSDKPLDKLVAMGAAIVAHDEDTVQIRDIISHSLGVELVDEKFSPILKKGENYPISTTQTYTTSMDFQKSVDVNVFEGEDEDDVNMNDFYGGFSLENIEQGKAGTPQIEVTFEFDKSRILKVTAKDVGSGSSRSEEIEIDKGSKKKILKSPYTKFAGLNIIDGVKKDNFGNAFGADYDLAKDNAFDGVKIGVLHLYTGEGFDFHLPKSALKEKGFELIHWKDIPPSPTVLRQELKKTSQLWIISSNIKKLNLAHMSVIKDYFNEGKGVYIWGDNEPFYADANFILENIFDSYMSGNTLGDKVVTLQKEYGKSGLIPNHPITTGIENVYEGITIATIFANNDFEPLIYGSDNQVVSSFYNKDGKRAIIDGGFTRLFVNWNTAGTSRYVKNAGAWLSNFERFQDAIWER
jgi:molecular chaperone DnaK